MRDVVILVAQVVREVAKLALVIDFHAVVAINDVKLPAA